MSQASSSMRKICKLMLEKEKVDEHETQHRVAAKTNQGELYDNAYEQHGENAVKELKRLVRPSPVDRPALCLSPPPLLPPLARRPFPLSLSPAPPSLLTRRHGRDAGQVLEATWKTAAA